MYVLQRALIVLCAAIGGGDDVDERALPTAGLELSTFLELADEWSCSRVRMVTEGKYSGDIRESHPGERRVACELARCDKAVRFECQVFEGRPFETPAVHTVDVFDGNIGVRRRLPTPGDWPGRYDYIRYFEDSDTAHMAVTSLAGPAAVLFGYAVGADGMFIRDLLDNADSITATNADQRAVVVETRYGVYRFELSPKTLLPIRIELRKSADDLGANHRALSEELPPLPPSATVNEPYANLQSEWICVSDIVYDKSTKLCRPVACTVNVKDVYVTGEWVASSWVVEFVYEQLTKGGVPFEISIVNGTRVIIDSAPGLHYEWQDGQVKPVIDREAIRQLDAAIESARRWRNR